MGKYTHQKTSRSIRIKSLILLIGLSTLLASCATVKQYEKVYINDADMTLSSRASLKHETAFHVYREGASGANGGKSGGGCGCN